MRFLALVTMLLAAIAPAFAEGRRIAPLDSIQVRVVNLPELDAQVRVAPDGTVSLPYVGRIRVAGASEEQMARRIKSGLESKGVIRDAQVSVNVMSFGAQVYVTGAVRSAGAVVLDRPMTVLEVISKAGGLAQAYGPILLRRQKGRDIHVVNLDSKALLDGRGVNPYVQNGDEIVVEEAPVFFLYGHVNRPGAYPMTRTLTVQQALATGGGIAELGSESRIEIKRKRRDGVVVVERGDLDAIVHANDTIIVKERWF